MFRFIVSCLLFFSFIISAEELVENVGCDSFIVLMRLVEIERHFYFSSEIMSQMVQAEQALCAGEKRIKGSHVKYANGKIATTDWGEIGGWWYYPNGVQITPDAGEVGGWWYYPNGKLATTDAGEYGGWWFYPNGKGATTDWNEIGGWWYYPNGKVATMDAGVIGGWWFYPNGKRATVYAGRVEGLWFYSDETFWQKGVVHSKEQLLNAPRIMLWLLRASYGLEKTTGDYIYL